MEHVLPPKLRPGSLVRVVAPARSRAMITEGNENAVFAERHLADLGLRISYGEHVDERDRYDSSSIASRVADLHDAYADPSVEALLTVVGGFNSNELLPHLDFDLIRDNPKILCGYSDITALQNAITAMTGVVTYSGPHWSTFGMRDLGERTREWFRQTLMSDDPVVVEPSTWFTDDLWFLDQANRTELPTDGWWVLHPGHVEGRIVGGNLCTLNLLQGTAYMPSIADTVLFVEDDETSNPVEFRRDIHSLMQQPRAETVRALVIGRFQQASQVSREDLRALVADVPNLRGKPVLANVDFGHTNPAMTFPIGGTVQVVATENPRLTLTRH
jgi:muramoyltetrapeptide carboxypeptidase LdcA involved in peptidoglycan recycling